MFEFDPNNSFPKREEEALKFWKEKGIFAKSLQNRKNAPLFATYDGPPFATGLPHYGHILAGTIKDAVLRYKTMRGFCVPRRFGWDCHGLPIENEIEKTHKLSGAPAIEEFGVGKFNELCRGIVDRYTKEWESTVARMGRWVDFNEIYRTMDPTFMESVWWVFSELFEKGLVYEGFKVMPYSAKLGTPISNFEANLNYKDVDDPSVVVIFPVKGEEASFLAWTTTPWTLPSNLALAVGPDVDYVRLRDDEGRVFILAEARVEAHFKKDVEIIERMKGADLGGKEYEPIFAYFVNERPNAFRVLVDEFVGAKDGTGVVHMAPAFGESDFDVCKKAGIESLCPIDANGYFTDEVPEYAGKFVKDADKEICRELKGRGRLFSQGTINHRYPFCWRSDTPLIYRTISSWFVSVEKIKERIIAANEEINWVPEHIKQGRFGKWLEGARDWAISRNRFWGTPLPLWRSESGKLRAISSKAELEELTGAKVDDLHRHFIDDLTFEEGGETYRRVSEVFDCWFESGSMPYAQNHYPFDNKEATELAFPADFIAEGLDQTRAWFYTLNVLSVALFDKPAFKNVIVNGIVLADDGQKMSKSLKNYPDPQIVIDKYGSDVIRLYLLSSPAVSADDVRFSERGVELMLRQALIPLWNSYVFMSTYAKIYNWQPGKCSPPKADIDRWVLSRLQGLCKEVTGAMDAYTLNKAVPPLLTFVDDLTNWYIRRNRTRFWAAEASADRDDAFQTLYTVLKTFVQLIAPVTPFIAESIYQQLRVDEDAESVHLCDFPQGDDARRDLALEAEMSAVQKVVSGGHSLRNEHKVKVRQPIGRAHLITSDSEVLNALERQSDLIADELNVKAIEFHSDESKFVTLNVKPNFPVLGKKVGKAMRAAQCAIAQLPDSDRTKLLNGKSVEIELEGVSFTLTAEDVSVQREVKEGLVAETVEGMTVALDLEMTEELLLEGIAREYVNKINTMRRDQEFEVTDRVKLTIETSARARKAFEIHHDFIVGEVLATDVHFASCEGAQWDLNGEKSEILVEKV